MKQLISQRKKAALFLSVIAAMAALALFGAGTYAWFFYSRSMNTMTKIEMPAALTLAGKDGEALLLVTLPDLDPAAKSADYLFSVKGSEVSSYALGIAYTQNIPFTYRLYHASQTATGVPCTAPNGEGYYLGSEVVLTVDNTPDGYANTDDVHPMNRPVYKKNQNNISSPSANDDFIEHFVLRLSWVADEFDSGKETDMIYIFARSAE